MPFLGAVPARWRGVILMIVSTMFVTAMQATIRKVGQDVHPFEVAFFRNFFGLIIVLPLLYRAGFGILRTSQLKLHAVRGVLQTGGMLLFFTALTLAPLAQTVALSFTAPLFTAVLAILILRERADWQRWTALIGGLVGAWVVIRPGFAEVNIGTWFVILSSCTWGTTMIIIKYLGRTESSLTITVYMGLFMAPLSAIPAAFVWQWPATGDFLLLVLVGCLGGLAHLLLAQAFKEAEAGAILPFDFLRLIWASAIGFLLFAEVPDAWTWIGGAVIFGATTYMAIREARHRQRKPVDEDAATSVRPR